MTWFRRETALEMIDLASFTEEALVDRLAAQVAASVREP